MALRQDSDKEPRIELFIKVSCSTFTNLSWSDTLIPNLTF